MGNPFSGTGNLGTAPTLRRVASGGEEREVAEMRVYFDRSVPKQGGGFEDKGGFWLTVAVWGARAALAAKVLQKGARVQATGTLRQETWKDKDTGAGRSELRLTAETLGLDLACVESVEFKKRGGANTGPGAAGGGGDPDGHIPHDGEDIPF